MERQIGPAGLVAFLLLPLFLASPAAGQGDGPRASILDGNWKVTWSGFPEGGATTAKLSLSRTWDQTCIRNLREECHFFPEARPNEPWRLTGDWWDGKKAVSYYDAKSLAVDTSGGAVLIEHAYRVLGHWGGTERMLIVGPDELSGEWTYVDQSGTSKWQRVTPVLHSIFAQGRTHLASAAIPEIPIRFKWEDNRWLPTNQMRGNRPKIDLVLRGSDLWGEHRAVFLFSPGFEVHAITPIYQPNPATGRDEVVGQKLEIVLWPGVEPGVHPLVMGSLRIPIKLQIDGFPGNRCDRLQATIADLKKISADLAAGVLNPQLAAQFGRWAGSFHRDVSSNADTAVALAEGTVSGTLLGGIATLLLAGDFNAAFRPAAWGPGALLGIWYSIGKETVMQTANWKNTDLNTAFHEYVLTAVEYPGRQRYMTRDTIGFLRQHRTQIEALTGQPLPTTGDGLSIQRLRAYLDQQALALLYYFGSYEEAQGSSKFPRHKLNVEGRYGGQRYAADYWRRVLAAEIKPRLASLEMELEGARKKLCPQ